LKTNTEFDFDIQSAYYIYVQTDDGRGGTFAKVFRISIITKIIENVKQNSITMYPNPSKGIFTIETSDACFVSVIDIHGKSVKEFSISNSGASLLHRLDLSDQPPGIYFIKFQNDKTIRTKKIIIE